MASILLQFPPPPRRSYQTSVEQEGLLNDVSESVSNSLVLLSNYPDIQIHDGLASVGHHQRDNAQVAFLKQEYNIWTRIVLDWRNRGLSGMLEGISEDKEVPDVFRSSSEKSLSALQWLKSRRDAFFPQKSMSRQDLMSKYSHVSNWSKSPIQVLAWHPHITKLAIALHDDSVQVHASGSSICPILKHKLQKQVADLAWQPLSASVLAVACQTCILIWHVDPSSLAVRPSSSTVQMLQASGHYPVTSLTWSPDSSNLVSASPCDASLMVWDVPCETGTAVRRDRVGGVPLLTYSPDGTKLFTGTSSTYFRVWETITWQSEVWSHLSGQCKTACWNPEGTILLFATEGDSSIYAIKFVEGASKGSHDISIAGRSVVVANVSEIEIPTSSGENVRIGGQIKSIEWDSSGERLAVMFEANEFGNNHYIALFKVTVYPVLELLPGGFIKGRSGESAHHIAFQPNFEGGALLSIAWSSGRVGYVPLFFIPSQEIGSNKAGRFAYTSIAPSILSPIRSP